MFTSILSKYKSLSLWKKILLLISILIITGVVWSRISHQQELKANREIVVVTKEDLKKEVIRSGQIELQGVVEVTPSIGGVITDLLVSNDQQVSEGQLLFKIKSNATNAEINQARANYLNAKNEYDNAKIRSGVEEWNKFEIAKKNMIAAEQERKSFEEKNPDKTTPDNTDYQQLKLNESIARRTLDAETLIPNQVAQYIEASKASYQAALSSYNASRDGSYTSPIKGRIENIGINEGENVIAEVGDKEGTPLFLIVPEGVKTISMQIGPNDAMILKEGQKANVRTDYVKNKTFDAQVVRIDKVGKNVEGKGLLYRAWLEVADTENQLLLGIPVEISITTEEKTGVLTLPSEAIHDNYVTVVKEDNTYEERAVEVNLKANGKTEIVSGLQEGEQVLIDRNIKK